MLQNAYFLAKIGADTAENERNFAENLPKIGNYPTANQRAPGGVLAAARRGGSAPAGPVLRPRPPGRKFLALKVRTVIVLQTCRNNS